MNLLPIIRPIKINSNPFKALFFLCSLLLLLNSCATVQLGDSAQIVQDDAFGLAHAGGNEDSYIDDYAFMKKTNTSWIRQTFQWNHINNVQKEWDFSKFNKNMEEAEKNGAKVIAVLGYDAAWIHKYKERTNHISAEQLPLFLNYVREVVTQYKDQVDAWEIWNEPNLFFWKGPDEDFFTLALEAAKIVKELDPDKPLLAGSTFQVPEAYIRNLNDYGIFDYADALSIHPYDMNPERTSGHIEKAKKLLSDLGLKKELWITEVGYPTRGYYITRVSPFRYPEYVIKTLAAATSQGVRVTIWYKHYDTRYWWNPFSILDSESFFGLAHKNKKLKWGGKAFSVFTENTKGAFYNPELVTLDETLTENISYAAYENSEDNSIVVYVWNNKFKWKKVTIKAASGTFDQRNIVSGKIKSKSEEWTGYLRKKPVMLKFSNTGKNSITITPF